MGAPDFWDNPDAAQKTAQAVTQLKEEVGIVHNLEQRLDDLEVMVELALEEPAWKKNWKPGWKLQKQK